MNDKIEMACPSRNDLLGLLDESLVDADINRHISTCEVCQQTLDRLTDSADLANYRDVVVENNDRSRYFDPPITEGDLGSLEGLAIERLIGTGGMGDVFLARDLNLGRKVAVKVLSCRQSHESTARFLREAKSAAKLKHDHVVSVHSTGRTSDGTPYLVMPLIEGLSLKECIVKGRADFRQMTDWIRQIALGLEAAHSEGMVHRDVKPGNILLDASDGRAKLTDFGLARSLGDETLTHADVLTGTPQYMSPEQANGETELGPATDIYSLGITLYECLVGTAPFQGQPLQILEQHRSTTPLRPSRLSRQVPHDLDTVCMKAIAKLPSQRYASVAEFGNDLQRFLEGRPVLARESTSLEKFLMWCGRNRTVATLAGTTLLLLLTLVVASTISAWRLRSANAEIVGEKEKATSAEKLAVADRNAAIAALETVVDSLYEELADNAASIQTREQVINAAIDGLEAISKVDGDMKSDRTACRALMRIGDLCFLKGDQASGELNYDDAVKIARTLHTTHPDDLTAKRELATVLGRFAANYLRIGNVKYVPLSDEATKLLKEVVEKEPTDFDALLRLVVQHDQQMEQIRFNANNEPQKVIDYGESIIKDIKQVIQLNSGNRSAYETAQKIHFNIGRGYLESSQPAEAAEHFTQAKVYIDQALIQAPKNVKLLTSAAIIERAHGMALASQARLDDAIDYYQSALGKLKRLAAADPTNAMQQQHVANTQTIASLTYMQEGRFDEAADASASAVKIFEDLLELNPDNEMARVVLVQTRFQLAGILVVDDQLDEVELACKQIRLEMEGKKFAANFLPAINYFRSGANIIDHTAVWLKGNRPSESSSSDQCLALLLSARRDVRDSTTNQLSAETLSMVERMELKLEGTNLEAMVTLINGFEGLHPFVGGQVKIGEAALYGRLAENIQEAQGAAGKQEVDWLVGKSVAAIEAFAAQMPVAQLKEKVLTNYELKWLRGTDAFQTAWQKIVDSE
ncbi:MAG: protein kinase [Planctomycetota bacterium]